MLILPRDGIRIRQNNMNIFVRKLNSEEKRLILTRMKDEMDSQISQQLVQITILGSLIAIVLSAIGSIPMVLGQLIVSTTTNSKKKLATSFKMIAFKDVGVRFISIFLTFSCIKVLSIAYEFDLRELILLSRIAPILRDPQLPIPDFLREPILPLLKISAIALCIVDFASKFPISKTIWNWARFNSIIYGVLVGTAVAVSINLTNTGK